MRKLALLTPLLLISLLAGCGQQQAPAHNSDWSGVQGSSGNVATQYPNQIQHVYYGISSIVSSSSSLNKAINYNTFINVDANYIYIMGTPATDAQNQSLLKADKSKTSHTKTSDSAVTEHDTLDATLFPSAKNTISTVKQSSASSDSSNPYASEEKRPKTIKAPTFDFSKQLGKNLISRIKLSSITDNGSGQSYTINGTRQIYQNGAWNNVKGKLSINLIVGDDGATLTYNDSTISGQFKEVAGSAGQVANQNHFNFTLFSSAK